MEKLSKTVTMVIPRSVYTFHRLPNEDDSGCINRFIYSLLSSPFHLKKFVKTIAREGYIKVTEDDPDADWVDKCPRIVKDSEIDNI